MKNISSFLIQKRSISVPGGSFFSHPFVKPYIRKTNSLFHYPLVSDVTGKQINWMKDDPKSGYEQVRSLGRNTIELKNLPMGKTCEYLQERLRRFFSKFGRIKHCRCMPHPLDPYQCEGIGYITFYDKYSSIKAIKSTLKFPDSLLNKTIAMRCLDTDKQNDILYIKRSCHYQREIISISRELYKNLDKNGPRMLSCLFFGVTERKFGRGDLRAPGDSINSIYGDVETYLKSKHFNNLFDVTEGESKDTTIVRRRIQSPEYVERILIMARNYMKAELSRELSVWWREGRIPLPEYTQKQVDAWLHKEPIPYEIQVMSKPLLTKRIFEPEEMFKVKLKRIRIEEKKQLKRDKLIEEKMQKMRAKENKELSS
eukprot:GHVL01015647.1.p1 GENE.GHVL01015647.1~~GHVL01015647.1.p1  ORF type:complete len:370 (-),score=63.49 GHVL01015647.1:1144-2253(-)